MKFRGIIPVLIVAIAVGIVSVLSSGVGSKAEIIEIQQTGAGYNEERGYYVQIKLVLESESYSAYYVDSEGNEKLIGMKKASDQKDKPDKFTTETPQLPEFDGLDAGKSYKIRIYDSSKNHKDIVVRTVPAQAVAPKISSWLYNTGKYWVEFPTIQSAEGYQIRVENASGKKIKTQTIKADSSSVINQSLSMKPLVTGKIARLRVRGYITVNGEKKYGQWSDAYYFATPKKAEIYSQEKQIKLTGLKISGATKKVIYVSTKKNSGYKKVKTLKKKNSASINLVNGKELKGGNTYYVKVYYYFSVDGKTRRSPIVGSRGVNISKYGVKVGPLSLVQSV